MILLKGLILALAGVAAFASAQPVARQPFHLIPGSVVPNRGPDGNSVFLDAPDGLILIDTGRHPEHRDRLLAYARARERPIAAIVNTHWHLDHTTGNAELRAAYPRAEVHASEAIERALTGFFVRSRADTQRALDAGQVPENRRAEIARGFAAMDNPAALRATRPVTASGELRIAGRRLRVNLARFAATEGDVWLYDPATRVAIVGDLVVGPVPFMDTACAEGWRRALAEIEATPFTTLIPGHGAPMTRADFTAWRAAFNAFVDCGQSDRPRADCVAGWRRDAARFVPAGLEATVDSLAGYYIDSRLRSSASERARFCEGGPG
jgi:glyoxylase-like metal-dependent hydrolase (beta-lactamase superfamily II)